MLGETLDNKYRIVRLLGQGGMGSVYEAVHVETGQHVAVKLIRSDAIDKNVSLISRFKREVKAAQAIESPHVAKLFDAGTDPATGAPYMVMEYLAGEDLQQLLNRVGALPPNVALRIVAQVCLGLQKAHDVHVTHRDIKPANIFLMRGDEHEIVVKILDFGIAKIKGPGLVVAETTGLTNTGGTPGSPRYMSPEQTRGRKDVDSRSDIWSLGVVLYRALTGQVIHASASEFVELAIAICTKAPTPVQELAPWIPPEVVAIVDGVLQVDANARFQSAAALLDSIRPLLLGSSALSEEMLVPLGDAERSFVAPKFEKPPSKASLASMLDTVAPTHSGPVLRPGMSDKRPTKVAVPLRRRRAVPIAVEEGATSLERTAPRTTSRSALALAMAAGIALLGAGALFWQKKSRGERSPVVEASAAQIRNAERMTTASTHQEDPTTVLALLREIEPGPPLPRGWDEVTRAAGYAGVALMVVPHDGAVFSAAYSPDGQHIVTASGDNMVRIWNADGTGEPLVLRGHAEAVFSATYSPDGKRIVSSSQDKTLRIWNADGTGQHVVVRGHDDAVISAVFSPDGKRIVSASQDKTVRVWNLDGSRQVLILRGHEWRVYSAAWSPDGQRIVSASEDKTMRVWNADGKGLPRILRGHDDAVWAAAFSPDGRHIVSGSLDSTVRVWNADGTGQPLVLRGHGDKVGSVAFSLDGRRIVSASEDKTVRVWDADGTGQPLVFRGHNEEVRAAFSPDSRRIVSASRDQTMRVWDADGTEQPLVLRGHESAVESAAFSPDSRRIASGSSDKTVRVWNADGSGQSLILRGHDDWVSAVAFSPDGRRIVSASGDKTVRVWNADGVGQPLILRGHEADVLSAAFSPDGRRIVSASRDKAVRVWTIEGTSQPLVLRGHDQRVYWAAFSPDGQHIVSASEDKTVRVWNADGTGQPLILRGHEDFVGGAAFSPDSLRIVSASGDKTLRVWNANGAGLPLVLRGHDDRVSLRGDRSWSPDGKRIVSASYDSTVRIWNADGTGEPIVLYRSSKGVNSASWSSDGKRIVAALEDKTVMVFRDVEPLRDAENPKLWAATTYCMPLDLRKRLLSFTDEQSRQDLERCQRHVHESRVPSTPTQR